MKNLKVLGVSALLLMVPSVMSWAADIEIFNGRVYIVGRIEKGDFDKFEEIYKKADLAEQSERSPIHDIPTAIFELFIERFGDTDIPAESVAALNKALLEEGNLKESAIRAALLPDDQDV